MQLAQAHPYPRDAVGTGLPSEGEFRLPLGLDGLVLTGSGGVMRETSTLEIPFVSRTRRLRYIGADTSQPITLISVQAAGA